MAFAAEQAAPPFRRGSAAAASPAAVALPQLSEDSPLPFYASSANNGSVGVFCTGPNQFEVQVAICGKLVQLPPFTTRELAEDAFCAIMGDCVSLLVAGAPGLARAPAPAMVAPAAVSEPAPAPPHEPARAPQTAPVKRYKGVYAGRNAFVASVYYRGKQKYLGSFPTAEEAADAYDAAMRRAGGKVVNTPRRHGEIQAECSQHTTPSKKRGRPRKVIDEDGAAAAASPAAAAGNVAERRSSPKQPLHLNFPTAVERQTRSTSHLQAGRQMERKMLERDDDGTSEEEEEGDYDRPPLEKSYRVTESPALARRGADVMAQAASPPPEAPPAPTPAPAPLQSQPPPPPSASQLQQDDDVVVFLRNISPPLRCLDAAVAAVPGSGVSMRQLRQLPLMLHSTVAAAYIDRVAKALHIEDGGDKLDLLLALDRLAGP